MLLNPLCKRQQNIKPLRRLTETAENHLNPVSHTQNPFKLNYNLANARFLGELQVEAANTPLKILKAEKAAVGAAVGDI
jgi:CRISPR/Cas system CSM-associated protein Csm3 (group 7 of RAMP superfamily)